MDAAKFGVGRDDLLGNVPASLPAVFLWTFFWAALQSLSYPISGRLFGARYACITLVDVAW